MSCFVCMLEEASAGEMLAAILPKLLPEEMEIRVVAFEGKQDLLKRLELRLSHWLTPDSYFLVMLDKDCDDCIKIKERLKGIVEKAGKTGRVLIRIACCELESFYLGDLAAVENGLCVKNCAVQQARSKFRNPDALTNAAEELKKLTSKKYQKISGSRDIAPHLSLDGSNKSYSFNMLVQGIKGIVGTPDTSAM